MTKILEHFEAMNFNKLLIELKSVTQIKSAALSDLEKIVGNSKAKLVYNHFNFKS